MEERSAKSADDGGPTIFDKILSKEINATIVYEDDKVKYLILCEVTPFHASQALAFRDIEPQAPVHVILIPKQRDGLTRLANAEKRHRDILGHLLYVAKKIGEQEKLQEGYRVVINDGPKGCKWRSSQRVRSSSFDPILCFLLLD
ncbi:14 kDa zinc-binding protein isoform X3 [Selaginella moellendorffii]|uniref:14 kDa zinc-binding protein isoform X3 n=1 Tax=Selaginella moellendorffii TaxID=88036 RepID=UPI000D1C7561|nr:14 kDa zinc-binding protein isoform X3 [Selaginella moellendorffii]|eukprot:XP_024531768.1 14 kDa zinc-binding protein isoform X3 [Selaginella moellendorffii]